MKKKTLLIIVGIVVFLFCGCSGLIAVATQGVDTAEKVVAEVGTQVGAPTYTAQPTYTTQPTYTPLPTDTPYPTAAYTNTPMPTYTPAPTRGVLVMAGYTEITYNCTSSLAGVTKVKCYAVTELGSIYPVTGVLMYKGDNLYGIGVDVPLSAPSDVMNEAALFAYTAALQGGWDMDDFALASTSLGSISIGETQIFGSVAVMYTLDNNWDSTVFAFLRTDL